MKGIRSIALGLALVAGSATIAGAQEAAPQQAGQGRRGGMGAAQLLEGITLTADQQAKVDTIQKAHAPKLQAAREEMRSAMQAGGDRAEVMKKMQAANGELQAAIKAVLTTEQQTIFAKNVEAAEARRRERMQQQGGGRPPR